MRVCLDCPELTTKTRCPRHQREREHARGSAAARGYGADHKAERARLTSLVATGNVKCWRCGKALSADAWTLGHCDIDRRKYHGPECPPCDYATAGRDGCPHPSHN